MNKKDLFAMNLQFFADEDNSADANETVTVEQSEGEEVAEAEPEESQGDTEAVAEPQFQTEKANAAFASMRREVEAARQAQAEIDSMFTKQFGQYTNPETGMPIRSAKDYMDAMAAQERMQVREQLKENNIDPNVIDSLIANSPAVREARAMTAELNSYRANNLIAEDFKKVLKLDPSKTSEEDIINDPSYNAVVGYVQTHPGTRFDEAYKLVNFDRLTNSKGAAAKQATINEVKSKNHLSTGTSLDVPNTEEDIPASMLENFKELFPEKSMKELKALYNKTITERK